MYIMRQSLVDIDEDDEIFFAKDGVTVDDIEVDDSGRTVGVWKEKALSGKTISHRVTPFKFYANTWQFI